MTGELYLITDPKADVAQVVAQMRLRYFRKREQQPDTIFITPGLGNMFKDVISIEVVEMQGILPRHFVLGVRNGRKSDETITA